MEDLIEKTGTQKFVECLAEEWVTSTENIPEDENKRQFAISFEEFTDRLDSSNLEEKKIFDRYYEMLDDFNLKCLQLFGPRLESHVLVKVVDNIYGKDSTFIDRLKTRLENSLKKESVIDVYEGEIEKEFVCPVEDCEFSTLSKPNAVAHVISAHPTRSIVSHYK